VKRFLSLIPGLLIIASGLTLFSHLVLLARFGAVVIYEDSSAILIAEMVLSVAITIYGLYLFLSRLDG